LNPTETPGPDPVAPPDGDVSASQASERLSPEEVQSIYEVHGTDLLLFLTGVLRNRELAEEALQNTFQRVLEQGHTARPESVKGWLFKVGFHEALVLKRRQATRDKHLRIYGDQRVRPAGDHTTGEQELRLIRDEDVARLRQALQHLPPEQRDVVERRLQQEQTFAAIAAELKVPLGTVLTRMRLALEKLQRYLQESP
jgi:RNA polymerase sigma factor (sigma-70 family)